jgi:potassium channel subfamily K
MAPQTPAGKLFTCVFGLVGIALLGAAVATIGSRLVQAEIEAAKLARRQSQKSLLQVYDRMPKLVTSLRRASKKEHKKVVAEAKQHLSLLQLPHVPPAIATVWKATRWILQSMFVVAFGDLVIGRFEGSWSWQNSLYYSLITGKKVNVDLYSQGYCLFWDLLSFQILYPTVFDLPLSTVSCSIIPASTIGLGDFAPVTRAGRLAAVVVILMAVAAAGEILAGVGLALVEKRKRNCLIVS